MTLKYELWALAQAWPWQLSTGYLQLLIPRQLGGILQLLWHSRKALQAWFRRGSAAAPGLNFAQPCLTNCRGGGIEFWPLLAVYWFVSVAVGAIICLLYSSIEVRRSEKKIDSIPFRKTGVESNPHFYFHFVFFAREGFIRFRIANKYPSAIVLCAMKLTNIPWAVPFVHSVSSPETII